MTDIYLAFYWDMLESFFKLSKLFISFLISFGVTSKKLDSVDILKYSFTLNILEWSTYLLKLISIGSEFTLLWDTWGPLTYRFFTAASKKLLNSSDKLLS